MTTTTISRFVLPTMLALLPPAMDTPAAQALLLAIGLQESGFTTRLQHGGPARGYWQFELGGVYGVLTHPASLEHAQRLCAALDYPGTTLAVHEALAHNDLLACGFARLLLWTLPGVLASRSDPSRGWQQYLAGWRPGTPRPETWTTHFRDAWALVEP